jgi:hypothetical protein|tara:strand:+ start:3582 stop:3797 length:216 start_codon:yes stop_codon:yes gene_type:complete
MKKYRDLPRRLRCCREIGWDSECNSTPYKESLDWLSNQYGKEEWCEMNDAEKTESLKEFRNGQKEERLNNV